MRLLMSPVVLASDARSLMTDHVAPSKGELLKYRVGILTQMKSKIQKAASRNKKYIKYCFEERFVGDGSWFQGRLRKEGFAVTSWASGSIHKNVLTIAWVGDAPSPLEDSKTWMWYPAIMFVAPFLIAFLVRLLTK